MNRVLQLRNDLSMTQDEFAEYCNVARISIARYEAGAEIHRSNAVKIASACGVSVDYVLGNTTEEKATPAGEALNHALVDLLLSLTPEQVQLVQAYISGLKASETKRSSAPLSTPV